MFFNLGFQFGEGLFASGANIFADASGVNRTGRQIECKNPLPPFRQATLSYFSFSPPLWHPNTDLEKTSTVFAGPRMPASNSAMKNFRAFAMPVRHALISESESK